MKIDGDGPARPNLKAYMVSTIGELRDMLRALPDWPLVIDGIDLPFGLVVDNENRRIEFRKSTEQNAREHAAIDAATRPAMVTVNLPEGDGAPVPTKPRKLKAVK